MWLPTEDLGGCPYPGDGGTQELQTDSPSECLYPADSCNAVALTEDLRGCPYPGDDGVAEAPTTQLGVLKPCWWLLPLPEDVLHVDFGTALHPDENLTGRLYCVDGGVALAVHQELARASGFTLWTVARLGPGLVFLA